MKDCKSYLFFLILMFASGCNIQSNKVVLYAENIFDFRTESITFYNDSTYIFRIKDKLPDTNIDSVDGRYVVRNDTFFLTGDLIDSAYIRRGYLEFIRSELKLKILTEKYAEKDQFLNISVFRFDSSFYKPQNYSYDIGTINPYDITDEEIKMTEKLIKKCFQENQKKLNPYDQYIFQLIPTQTNNQEIIIWVSGFCKDPLIEKQFKVHTIDMCDGGNCNIRLKVNITKKSYFNFSVSGEA